MGFFAEVGPLMVFASHQVRFPLHVFSTTSKPPTAVTPNQCWSMMCDAHLLHPQHLEGACLPVYHPQMARQTSLSLCAATAHRTGGRAPACSGDEAVYVASPALAVPSSARCSEQASSGSLSLVLLVFLTHNFN